MAGRDNYWLRRRVSRRSFLYGSGAAAAGFALVGCGNDDDDNGNGGGNGDPTQPSNGGDATPTTGTGNGGNGSGGNGEPRSGGTLNLIWNTPDAHWDPHSSTEHFSPEVYRAVSHGLLKQESITSFPQPDFATEWETADEGLRYIFHLNPDARWHDVAPVSGRAVTADDVVFSLERISTPGPDAPRASSFETIESYEAIDEHTIAVNLEEPFVPILASLSDKWTVIVAPEVVDQFGDLKQGESIVGFGPFITDNAETSSGATLRRYEDYWGDPAYLDEIIYTTIRDEDARQAAFQSGQADVSSVIPELFLDRFTGDDVEVYEYPDTSMATSLIGGPNDKPPLNDERVRRAISLAINRVDLGQAAFPGATQQNAGLFANPVWGLSAEEVAEIPGFNPNGTTEEELTEARQLISDSGHDGAEIVLNTTAAYEAHHINRAEALVPMLGQIGLNVRLNVLEYAAFKDQEVTRELQMTAATYAAYGDPHTPLNNTFHSTGTRNYWNWSDPDYDAMVEDQKAELDEDARLEKIHEMQRYLLNGTPVSSALWFQPIYLLARKRVRNWQGTLSAGAPCSGWYLPTVWLDA